MSIVRTSSTRSNMSRTIAAEILLSISVVLKGNDERVSESERVGEDSLVLFRWRIQFFENFIGYFRRGVRFVNQ